MKLRILRRKTAAGMAFDDVLQSGAIRRAFVRSGDPLPEDAEVIFFGATNVEYEYTEWEDVPLVYEQPTRDTDNA